MVRLQLWDTAG
jgi:Ras-related protein Rab-6A